MRRSEAGLGQFWILTAALVSSKFQFGTNNDLIVPGDYDADGKTDLAIARNLPVSSAGGGVRATAAADVNVLWGDGKPGQKPCKATMTAMETDRAGWRNGAFLIRGSLSGHSDALGSRGDFPTASFNTHGNNP